MSVPPGCLLVEARLRHRMLEKLHLSTGLGIPQSLLRSAGKGKHGEGGFG